MHSHPRRRPAIGRWLVTGAAALAVAVPVAASVSASAPPTEPSDSSAPAAESAAPAGSEAAGATCANVFPAEMPATSEAPSGTSADTGAADVAAPDTGAADTGDTGAADVAAPDTGAADTATAGSAADDMASAPASGAPEAVAGPFVQTAETALGTILVDAQCRALYAFTNDVDGESTCFEGCATAWPPLLVADAAVPELAPDLDPAMFSVVEHPLGSMLKVGDWPLYYFASDVAPGDLNGQGVNSVWFLVAPDGTLIGADAAPMDTGMAAGADSAPAATDTAATGSEY